MFPSDWCGAEEDSYMPSAHIFEAMELETIRRSQFASVDGAGVSEATSVTGIPHNLGKAAMFRKHDSFHPDCYHRKGAPTLKSEEISLRLPVEENRFFCYQTTALCDTLVQCTQSECFLSKMNVFMTSEYFPDIHKGHIFSCCCKVAFAGQKYFTQELVSNITIPAPSRD